VRKTLNEMAELKATGLRFDQLETQQHQLQLSLIDTNSSLAHRIFFGATR